MSNITLKTFASTNGTKYSLNQDNYSKMINDSQKSLNLIENNSDKSKYQKEYYNDRIVRARSDVKGSYFSSVPKSGTGNFSILDNFVPVDANLGDNKVGLTGKMVKGKIVELNSSNVMPAEPVTLDYVEGSLKKAESGEIKLENLTKVILKKASKFLKK